MPAGLGEALRLMVAGDKWRVYLPPALGFGDEGSERRDIGPAQALVYTLELVSIEGATTAAAARRGEAAHATLEGKADYFEWEDTTEPPWVLGLFRRPLYAGALHEGFQAAAARFGPSGEASFALSAESRYDAKAGKFIPSAVERMLGALGARRLRAPPRGHAVDQVPHRARPRRLRRRGAERARGLRDGGAMAARRALMDRKRARAGHGTHRGRHVHRLRPSVTSRTRA